MDMKKMIQRMTDLENAGKQNLNESTAINECPPMESSMDAPMDAPMAAQNPGNPVTMSISLNASGKDHVADLINMMKNAGLEDAKPAADAIMPMRMDMERLRGIVDEPEMENDAAYAEVINDDELEEYENEPNPEYQDHQFMTKDLSGGLNREKKAYPAAQPGDNAMAVEDEDDTSYSIKGKTPDAKRELAKRAVEGSMEETIKAALYAALTEKKNKKPDADGDGVPDWADKKSGEDDHAGKKKGSKPKKGEVPPQFKKKTNESVLEADASDPKAIIRQRTIELARKANVSMKNVNLDKVYKYIEQRKSLGRGPISQQPEKIEKLIEYYQNMASKSNPNYNDRVMDLIYDKVVEMVDEVAPMIHNNSENAVSEISSDLAKRYTKNAKMDRDFNDDDIKRLSKSGQSTQDMQRRNSKRTKGINRAAKRIEK